jgi:AcrR family transcriptional regulator
MDACFEEFAAQEYENASLDRIVEAAGISKGGLYEYISSKEDLYLHVLGTVVARLYGHLGGAALPDDLLRRFRAVSEAAIGFYLEHPRCVAILARSGRISDPALAQRAAAVFDPQFDRLFETVDGTGLRFPLPKVLGHLKWLLVKTRNDFLADLALGGDRESVRRRYLEEWDFLLSLLERGVYP